MLFWRYFVYRIFVLIILGEGMDVVRSFGILWYLCFFVWLLIFVIFVREYVFVVVIRVNNGFFLFLVFLLLLYFLVLKNFGLFRKIWFWKVWKIMKIILFVIILVFFVLNMWIFIKGKCYVYWIFFICWNII